MMTPSLGARKLIMAAYLYYRRASPIIDDNQYDRLAEGVAARFDRLDPIIQWQLGSPLDIVTTGSHIKITRASEAGAIAWHRDVLNFAPHGHPINDWVWDDDHNLSWAASEP